MCVCVCVCVCVQVSIISEGDVVSELIIIVDGSACGAYCVNMYLSTDTHTHTQTHTHTHTHTRASTVMGQVAQLRAIVCSPFDF